MVEMYLQNSSSPHVKCMTSDEMRDLDELIRYIHSQSDGKDLLGKLFPQGADNSFYLKRLQMTPYINCILIFDQIKPSKDEKQFVLDNELYSEVYKLFPKISQGDAN